VRKAGKSVAQLHLVHLNPFPPNLGEVLRSYEVILVPEGNLGHLTRLVRSDFLVDAKVLSKVEGSPFRVGEIERAILQEIERLESGAAVPDASGQVDARGRGPAVGGSSPEEAAL
jgi:2-oxoglutarate ferredoxin oxidoreductase subunit alpha